MTTPGARASMRVVDFVAEHLDEDPAQLDPLGQCIDPDALDRLVADFAEDEYVCFRYHGLKLCVWGDGDVTAPEE